MTKPTLRAEKGNMTKQIQTVGEIPEHNCLNKEYCVICNQNKGKGISPELWQNICDIVGDDDPKKALRLEKLVTQAQQEAIKAERTRLLPYLMNGYEDVDDFVSSNYRQFMNSSNDPDDDSIQMAELYEQFRKELEALQKEEK